MPSPAWRMPLVGLPVPGTGVPIAAGVLAAPGAVRICPVRGSIALRALPEQATAPLLQPGDVEQRRAGRRPLVREEVRHLLELVVLRLLVREAHAVVERQPAVHLPVVLHVELGVVVEHAAFDELRLPAGTG